MNLAQARVVLRPRTQGEILDLAALWCFAADRWLYARLAAVVQLPALLLCLAVQTYGGWTWPQVWLLAIALCTVTQGVFTVATARAMFEPHVAARTVLTQFSRRLPSYLVALVISRVVLLVGAVTVVLLPAAWARVAFVHEASLLEGASPISGTERAWRLGGVHATEVVLLLGGLGLALFGGVVAVELLGHGIVEFVLQLGRPFGALFDEGGSPYALLGFHLAVPYLAVGRFVGYVDRRTRGDGWDIQLRMMALAQDEGSKRRAS